MANGAFKFKDNSGNVVSFISGSGSNISFSGGTLDLSGMTGLTLGNLTLSGTTQNAISASHAASYLLTSSFNTYSGTTNTVIGTLQTSTSSLNSFTSSTTSRLSSIETSSGSLNSYTSSNTTNINAIHTSTGSLNSFTSSANSRLNSIEGVSGSYATTGSNQFKNDQVITGSLTVTGFIETQELRTTYISSSILYRSGSTKFGDELSDTHAFTGSLLVSGSISIPGSNLISGSAQVDVMSTTNIARLATTGSITFVGNQIVSGSLTTTGNVNVNSDGIVINRSTSGEPYLFFRKDGVNRGSIYGADNTSGFRFFVGDSNLTLTLTSGSATITGNLTTTGTINGLSLPNDLFAQQFLLMGS